MYVNIIMITDDRLHSATIGQWKFALPGWWECIQIHNIAAKCIIVPPLPHQIFQLLLNKGSI